MSERAHYGVASDECLAAMVAERNGTPFSLKQAQLAYTQLYLRHSPRLLAFLARHVSADERDDLHQAVWSQVWQKSPGGESEGSFRAWLFTVTRNLITDHNRRQRRRECQELQTLPDRWSPPADELLAEEELMGHLRRCVEELDPVSSQVMLGRMTGKSYSEICALTGLPALAAHKRFHRAKRQLQSSLRRDIPT